MRTIRIDPLDERGSFDHDFYGSEEYASYVNTLRKYLKDEGFDTLDEEFVIKMLNHTWSCKPGPGY